MVSGMTYLRKYIRNYNNDKVSFKCGQSKDKQENFWHLF